MTPDIRPRPSPGSRIYSKEETLPHNQGITQRVGRCALNQGRVLSSHAYLILSQCVSLCSGSELFRWRNFNLLNIQPSNMAIDFLLPPSIITKGGLQLYLTGAVGKNHNLSSKATSGLLNYMHSPAIAWALLKASA